MSDELGISIVGTKSISTALSKERQNPRAEEEDSYIQEKSARVAGSLHFFT